MGGETSCDVLSFDEEPKDCPPKRPVLSWVTVWSCMPLAPLFGDFWTAFAFLKNIYRYFQVCKCSLGYINQQMFYCMLSLFSTGCPEDLLDCPDQYFGPPSVVQDNN